MNIEDVKKRPRHERRMCRANLRLYPSQMKFIDDHDLSIQVIFDKALDELGHKTPNPEDIEHLAYKYNSKSRGNGRNKARRQR